MTDKAALIATFRGHLVATIADLDRTQAEARSGTRVDGCHRPANRGERAAVTSQGYLTVHRGGREVELEITGIS